VPGERRLEMRGKLGVLGLLLILSVLVLAGCAGAEPQETETVETAEVPETPEVRETPGTGMANPASVYCQEQGGTLEMRTDADGGQYGVCIFPDGSECEEWAFFRGECSPGGVSEMPVGAAAARDAAMAYVGQNYDIWPADAPVPDMVWTEEDITEEGLVGSSTFRYTTDEWVVTVSFPIVAPDATVYRILIENTATGFRWEGEVDASGQVTETAAPSAGTPVVAW